MPPKKSVELTEEEARLFDFLIDVVKQNNTNTTLRVAGGWVRDKLLGRFSDDIDIVLEQLMKRINKQMTIEGKS